MRFDGYDLNWLLLELFPTHCAVRNCVNRNGACCHRCHLGFLFLLWEWNKPNPIEFSIRWNRMWSTEKNTNRRKMNSCCSSRTTISKQISSARTHKLKNALCMKCPPFGNPNYYFGFFGVCLQREYELKQAIGILCASNEIKPQQNEAVSRKKMREINQNGIKQTEVQMEMKLLAVEKGKCKIS